MVGIPNLPTDNLYKFLAVSGLFLFALGLVAPFALDQREIEWYWQNNQAIADRMNDRVFKISDLVIKEKIEGEKVKREWEKISESLEGALSKEMANFGQKVKERSQMRSWRDSALGFTKWAGAAIAVMGFGLWWWRVQRFQDAILKIERDKLQKDLQAEAKG